MNKKNIRSMIGHWNWVYWHYRKSDSILPKDYAVTKMFKNGPVLVWNSLGYRYRNHCNDLTIVDYMFDISPDISQKMFDTIVVLNCYQFRYSNINEIEEKLGSLCLHLNTNGRLIFGFNSIFLHWNRCYQSFDSVVAEFKQLMYNKHQLQSTHTICKPFKTDALMGDCLLTFNKI